MSAIDDLDVALPANIDAERTILGAILLDNVAFYEAGAVLESDDFSLDSHRRIYLCIAELLEQSRTVDIVTLSHLLAQHKEIGAIGGVAYLASLTEGLPLRPVISDYIRIVKDKSLARKVMLISSAAIARAADQSETAAEITADLIEKMESSLSSAQCRTVQPVSDILRDDLPAFNREANAPAIGTLGASLFTPEIDATTCGIHQGELCLLCARPGQGKSEAAMQAVLKNARRGLRVHIQSLEMKDWQLVRRMLRYMARIPIRNMRDLRCLTPPEKARLELAREELLDLPIQIDDTHELTCSEYRSRCVLAAKRWKADLIVTDYAQLLIVPKAKGIVEAAPKQAETLRHIARDYCRTLALAQLRRAPPNDLNRYPDIEDILGSSAFEQAAQIILLLHRTRENKKYTGKDVCFVGKIRETGTIEPLGIAAEPWGQFVDRYRDD